MSRSQSAFIHIDVYVRFHPPIHRVKQSFSLHYRLIFVRIGNMQSSFPNVVPVANKYLGRKEFLKAQQEHENNVSDVFPWIIQQFVFDFLDKKCSNSHRSNRTRRKTSLYTTTSTETSR